MKFLSAIRSHEWWGYKLPPLLAVGYGVLLHQGEAVADRWPAFVMLLAALAVGAVYVSLVNDLTDLREDLLAGKGNRMSGWPPALRYLSLLPSIIVGAYLVRLFMKEQTVGWYYLSSWIAFTLYSVPPFRFKKRGVLGVLADASGAHLFPALFVMSFTAQLPPKANLGAWMPAGVALWSFGYGLRGILWHQFSDRVNDGLAGVRTLATAVEPARFKPWALVIFGLELVGLALMLWWIGAVLPFVFLGIYGLMLLLFRRRKGISFLIVLPASKPPYHILMSSYYQIFLPLSLLLSDALMHASAWLVLAAHVLLFPGNAKRLATDVWRSIRKAEAVPQ